MPELPDLQVFSQNLNKQLAGKQLDKLVLHHGVKLDHPRNAFKEAVEGATLERVFRDGKELRFAFNNKAILGMHLMLKGKFHWLEEEGLPPHTIAEFIFNNKKHLVLTDYQYHTSLSLNPLLAPAPDALSGDLNSQFWKEALQSKATIKNLLLNQQVIRGIGNAYADEILWEARISPFSISRRIPPEKVKELSKAIKKVLTEAEKKIRKEAPGIIGGEVRDFMSIHNASQKQSPGGAAIHQKSVSGRKTFYTEEQELFS